MHWPKRETKREKSAMTFQKKGNMMKMERDKDGEVQDLAVLKRIKRAAESVEKKSSKIE